MTLQLTSIDHAPASLPYWHTLMDDLGRPPVHRVARVLGIGRRTVYRYNRTGTAPRVVCLAVFWLTSWGRAAVHAQAVNDARIACGYVEALRADVRRLEGNVEHLSRLATGAANSPLLGGLGGTPR